MENSIKSEKNDCMVDRTEMKKTLVQESKKTNIFQMKITIPHEKDIKRIILSFVFVYLMHYLYDFDIYVHDLLLYRILTIALHLLICIPVFLIQKKWGLYHEPKPDFKKWKQYVYGLLLLIPYFGVQFIVFGVDDWDGSPAILYMSLGKILWGLFYYLLLVPVTEEYLFRVYFQEEIVAALGKFKFLAPFISAGLFALVHIPQCFKGTIIMAFGAGIVLGYARYFLKECSFISIVMAHGLYDFLVFIL